MNYVEDKIKSTENDERENLDVTDSTQQHVACVKLKPTLTGQSILSVRMSWPGIGFGDKTLVFRIVLIGLDERHFVVGFWIRCGVALFVRVLHYAGGQHR